MSKTVDERVVSMQFDNKNFESNVQTSLSTLDKLKQSLNLTGASKGLENVSAAAKNVDMSTLGGAVESVRVKFSALEVMGITALTNITNSALNAGKRIASALTIEPVKTGFNEYELKMDSIKTIMASTGEKVETVNKYLDELNEYSDKTIYSFSDMTQNIGKFTNAGVKLGDAVLAIKGISNEAAVSGANANEASRAMYNFAQALSAGYVKLIDWKSIENANMATVEFKQQLIDTAVELKILTKSTDGMYTTLEGNAFNATKNFNEALQDQWMTTDVLVKTLGNYASETTDIGKKAYAAAQDVTKLSQVFDIAKETAQSGWAKTWEIIFGDIDQAKALFTPLSNFLNKVIDGVSDFRNNLLEGALSKSPWAALTEKLDNSGLGTIKKYADSITNISDKLSTFQSVVSNVWRGDYGNMEARWDKLDEEGHNSKVIQDLVNLGYDHKITVEDVEASYKKYGLTLDKTTNSAEKMTSSIEDLSDAQLKEAGFTEQEIKLYRELQVEAKRTGKPIKELIDDMSETDGRTLLIDSLKNAGSGLVGVFTALKNAWVEIFPPMTSIQLFNIIKAINEFSEKLRLTNKETGELTDNAKNLQRTFKGIFAVLDIITTIIGGPLKIAFKIISKILDAFGFNILDVTAVIGDALVGFRDWIDSILDFTKIFDNIVEWGKQAKEAFSGWFDGLMQAEDKPKYIIDGIVSALKAAIEFIKDNVPNIGQTIWSGIEGFLNGLGIDTSGFTSFVSKVLKEIDRFIGGFKNVGDVPQNMISGFLNGLKDGATSVLSFIWDLGSKIIETICNVLGIHSPSTEFAEVGQYSMEGFLQGIQNGFGSILETLKNIVSKCVEVFKNVDFGTVLASAMNIGGLIVLYKIGDALQSFAAPFEGIGQVLGGVNKVLDSFSGVLKSLSFSIKVETIKSLAIAIAILVASIWLLTKINDWGGVFAAIGAIVLLAGSMVGLVILLGKFGGESTTNMLAFSLFVASLGVSLLLLCACVKILESVDPDRAVQAIGGLLALIAGIAVMMWGLGETFNAKASKTISSIGSTIFKFSISLMLLALLAKIMSGMEPEAFRKGLTCVALLSALVVVLIYMCKSAGKSVAGIGKTILNISAGIFLMGLTVKMLAGIDELALTKGYICIAAFALIVAGLIYAITKFASPTEIKGVASTLLMVSISIGILAFIAVLLGQIDLWKLAQGIVAVGFLSAFMAILISTTRFVYDCKGNLIVLTVAIAVLTACVIALSLIDPTKLIGPTIALGSLMGIFALLVYSSNYAKGSIGTLIVMTLAVSALGGLLYLLSGLPWSNVIASAVALKILMMALSASLILIGKAEAPSIRSLATLFIMTMVISQLGNVLRELAGLPVGNLISSAISLGVLLGALTGSLLLLSKVKEVSTSSLTALIVVGVVVALLGGILLMLGNLPVASTIVTALSLSILLGAITGVCVIMSKAKVSVTAASEAALGLAAFVGILGGVLLILGGLSSIPGVKDFISSGGETLALIGYAIGNFVGSIIGGFGAGLTSGLPEMAANLSQFMLLLTPFIAGAKMLDASMLEGIKMLAETVLLLTAASLLEGIASWLTGGSSITKFATELIPFGVAMVAFSSIISGNIDANAVSAAANAGKTLAEMQSTIPASGGVFQAFTGEHDMETFGNDIVSFGRAMVRFSDTVAGNINEEAVTAAANAGKTMVEMQKTLPDTGGVFQWFTGNKDMEGFGNQLVPFGRAMVRFSKIVSADGAINSEAIQAAANAGSIMVEFQKTLPDTNGVFQFFTGTKDMDGFGAELVPFGRAIVRFSKIVSGENAINSTAIQAAANAGSIMVKFQQTLPDTGGIIGWFTGDKDMAGFGAQLVPFGRAMVRFSKIVDGQIKQDAVSAAANAGQMMLDMYNTLPNTGSIFDIFTGTKDMSYFSEQLVNYGKGVVEFSKIVSEGIDKEAVSVAATSGLNIVEILNTFPDSVNFEKIVNGLNSFGDAMVSFSEIITGNVNTYVLTAVSDVGKTLAETAAIIPDEVNFAKLTKGLTEFGKGIVSFSKSVSDGLNKEAIENAASIGKNISEMVAAIPPDIDMVNFSEGIASFGGSMKTLAEAFSGDNAVDQTAIDNAVTAGTKIGDMIANHIPDSIDITDYVNNLSSLGISLSSFCKAVSGENSLDKEAIENAVNAGTKIGDMLISHVPDYVEISDYIANISKLGIALHKFSKSVSGNNALNKDAIDKAVDSGTKIGDMLKNHIPEYVDIADYVDNIANLGEAIHSFSKSVSGQNSLNKEAIEKAVDAGSKIGDMLKNHIPQTLDVGDFVDNIPNVGTAIKSFSDEIKSVSGEDLLNTMESLKKMMASLKEIAGTGIDKFVEPFSDSKSKVTKAISTMTDYAVSALDKNGNYDEFKSVGKYMATGFANGISENTYKVEAQAKTMAEAAEKAAREVLDINSPSKVFRKIGGFVPEGFAQGIDRLSGLARNSAEDMARDSVNSTLSAVSYIADVINSDIDAEPTIRPVLDLTNVRSGANTISGLLSGRRTLSINTDNVGSISASMSRRQNGNDSSEIVSSIRALRDDIANMPRNSYVVNGVTYDDGSNISIAVKDLVRAARIERRI